MDIKVVEIHDVEKPRAGRLGDLMQKELRDSLTLAVIKDGRVVEPVTLRWYMGRSKGSSVVYCILRFGNGEIYKAAYGQAGGYGYCKFSAAAQEAFSAAGVEVDNNFGGTGMASVRSAVLSLAEHLGYNTDGHSFIA